MLGDDTVRGRDIAREEWRHIGIRCAIRKNTAYEAIAKRLRVGRKALGRAEFVAIEAICHDGQIVPLEPFVRRLPVHGMAALMCVEADAAACHRSLVAGRLAERFGYEVIDLQPR